MTPADTKVPSVTSVPDQTIWTIRDESLWPLRLVSPVVGPLVVALTQLRPAFRDDDPGLSDVLLPVLLLVASLVGAFVIVRRRTEILEVGLLTRTAFNRAHVIPWPELDRAELRPADNPSTIVAVLRGGREIPLPVPTGVMRRPSERALPEAAAAIEEARRRYRG